MNGAWFVTGTDTGVGKTVVTAALLHAFTKQGFRTAALKPVSAGCRRTAEGLRNEDAETLMSQASEVLPYETVNPCAFEPPIAPHIAAAEAGIPIETAVIRQTLGQAEAKAEIVLAEGAGGWLVPIGPGETMADVADALRLPVILVVGMRLGCLNHALLTAESIRAYGLPLAGWVGSCVDPEFDRAGANLQALTDRIDAPCLGYVPPLSRPTPERVAGCLYLDRLATEDDTVRIRPG